MDECGDHSPAKVDADFPLLLLAFMIIEPRAYRDAIIPAMGRLKLEFWPHEGVNFHSRDIRKQLGDFAQFHRKELRELLMENLAGLQLADLCAYPAARYVLKPLAANPAFDLVRGHLVGWVEIKRGGGE